MIGSNKIVGPDDGEVQGKFRTSGTYLVDKTEWYFVSQYKRPGAFTPRSNLEFKDAN
jgi:hypothetical protein